MKTIEISRMTYIDLQSVCEIERTVFPRPWTRSMFEHDLARPGYTFYIVARILSPSTDTCTPSSRVGRGVLKHWRTGPPTRRAKKIVGYGGMIRVGDEGRISTLAVDPAYQNRGIAKALMLTMAKWALKSGIQWLTLEVRRSNLVAQNLYKKFGFYKVAIRKGYYSDNNEDAIVMWTGDITSPNYKKLLEKMGRSLSISVIERIES
ncbi:MAG: ribosomal protein S18-alanine N-acetyltransferase [Actinomycetota bacterium]